MGRTFAVPTWAEYIAADDDRGVYVFDKKPRYIGSVWDVTSGERRYVGDIEFESYPVEKI